MRGEPPDVGAVWDLWHGEKVMGDPPQGCRHEEVEQISSYSPEFYSGQLCLKMDTVQAVAAPNCTLGG